MFLQYVYKCGETDVCRVVCFCGMCTNVVKTVVCFKGMCTSVVKRLHRF